MRRMVINGNLSLSELDDSGTAGYSSGGFMADIFISG